MNSEFNSNFKSYIVNMLRHKEALGYCRDTHLFHLQSFDRFCMEQFPEETRLTHELILSWAKIRKSESPNGFKRRLVSIRELIKYVNSIGVNSYVIPVDISAPQKQFIPHIFTDSELSSFFNATDHVNCDLHDQIKKYIIPVIFRIIYCCGLRPNEGRNLKRQDVNLDTGRVYIRETKRHKDRTVVLTEELLHLCIKYNDLVSHEYPDSEYFFPHPNGNARSKRWLRYHFGRCLEIAQVPGFNRHRARVYDLRHTFATRRLQNWLDEGEDFYKRIPYLSTYMGHSDFSSTAYYIHLMPERLVNSPTIDWTKFSDLLPEVLSL